MVKIISLIIFTMFPLLSHAISSLQILTNSNQVEIGEPIVINIIAKNIEDKLSSIDISDLKNNFGLEVIESANKVDGNTAIQELKLKLYPRQTGLLTIPELSFGEYKTLPLELMVNQAGTLLFESSYNMTSAWQRQQIILSTSVITPSKFARIELADFTHIGAEIYKLESNQIKLPDGRFKLTASWKLFPLISGKQTFFAPSVNYRLSGKVQRKFFPAVSSIFIKPLPSYIPPLMPVGNLKINSYVSPDNTWVVEFSSSDISPNTLSSLSVPIESITNIKFGEITTSSKLFRSITHTIPLLFEDSQLIELPGLVFRTFNPTTGKIMTLRTEKQAVMFISTWLKIFLSLLAIFMAYKLISISFTFIRKSIARKQEERVIIKSILDATSPQELHLILNKYAAIKKWGDNLPLSQWSIIWSHYHKTSADKLINELSLACYSRNYSDISQTMLNRKIYNLISG